MLNNVNKKTLRWMTIVALLLVALVMFSKKSMYQAKPIEIETVNEKSIFDLERKGNCLPGPDKDSDAYVIPPNGICGAQKLVRDHASYKIAGGIGGVLI